jgi:hypothetical protein
LPNSCIITVSIFFVVLNVSGRSVRDASLCKLSFCFLASSCSGVRKFLILLVFLLASAEREVSVEMLVEVLPKVVEAFRGRVRGVSYVPAVSPQREFKVVRHVTGMVRIT